MPTYLPLRMDASVYGVNLGRKADQLAPGEAQVSNNVEFTDGTIRQRKGFRNACTGTLDAAFKGGAPAQSISLLGEEWWLDPPYQMKYARIEPNAAPPTTNEQNGRRDFFNQRPSFIVIPEGNTSALRLDVQAGDPDWAIEFLFLPEMLPTIHSNQASLSSALMVPIVAQKGHGTAGQWAVRLIPDATSTDRFYAVLTLYEGGVLGTAGTPAGVDFFYSSGANRAWVEPGKRTWVAWKFNDSATGSITSYYRLEGQTSSVNSAQDVNATSATLRTNGVGTTAYPITVGRRPYQGAARFGIAAGAAANSRVIDEIGFVGPVPEWRFWLESAQGVATTLELPANFGTVTAAPPAATDWYVESEIPEEQLTTDAAVEASNLVQTTDLQLYYQFKPELVGANADGSTNANENHRFLRPRFTRGVATDNPAWLTGADATWVTGTGALGSYALALVPAFTAVAAQNYVFANATARSGDLNSPYGQRVFCGGLRVPNSDRYLRKDTGGGASTYVFPDEFQTRAAFRLDALPSDTTYEETLCELCVARKGGGGTEDRYTAQAIWRMAVAHNGANWIMRLTVRDAAGTATTLDSTTTVSEQTVYVMEAGFKHDGTNRFLAVFVNGARENTASAVATKPYLSQDSGTDTTSPNEDDEDDRKTNFPFVLGFSVDSGATAAAQSPWNWRYGAWSTAGVGRIGSNRPYWAFHTNDTLKAPNDGIGYRGHNPLVGVLGNFQVWHKFRGEGEARELSTRSPTSEEVQRDGAALLSNWDMEDGQGVLVKDSGSLRNHLRINPHPTAMIASGACERVKKPPLLGLWQKHQISSSGSVAQQTYAVAPGVILKAYEDGSGNRYLRPIGKCQTPEMWDPANQSYRLPTAFQFGTALYVCTGMGPVKRVDNDRVSDAGLTPVYGNIGDDQTNRGWREFDRDGTFQATVLADSPSAAAAIFAENRKYGWLCTYYDSVTGIESAPSRPMYLTAKDTTGGGNGWLTVSLSSLPRSPQPQAGKIRFYRTTADGGTFKYVGEIAADQFTFTDGTADAKLQSEINSWLNYPPPMNARIGLGFNSRGIYFGCEQAPDTIFYSMLGQPGACPPQYQLTITAGKTTELTGGVVINDRCFVFTRTATYALFDAGNDIALLSQDLPPVQLLPVRDDLGCISHHGIITIEGFGAIIPTERGLYLFDGVTFTNLGRRSGDPVDRIQPFWQTLNMAASRNFVGIAHRRKTQYHLYCSTTSTTDGVNDRALVWDWARNAFSFVTNRDVVAGGEILNEDNGQVRAWVTTRTGNVFEFDPPETVLDSDGPTAAPFSGTIQQTKKDPLASGKYTRLKLVTGGTLATAGDGLRGVNLYVTNSGTQWHTVPLKILWNDGNWVTVEAAAANTTDPNGFEWRLGAIAADWESGKMNFGDELLLKRIQSIPVNFEPSTGTTLYATVAYDEQAAQSKTLTPSNQYQPIVGTLGRGRRAKVRFHVTTLYGGLPNNPWEVAEFAVNWLPKGRASHVPA